MSYDFKLLELKATYTQESDGCQPDQFGQYLGVRTEDAGGGRFLILETKRWAISGPDELQALLADFIGRGAGLSLGAGQPTAPPKEETLFQCGVCNRRGPFLDDCPDHKGEVRGFFGSHPFGDGFSHVQPVLVGPHQAHEYGFGTAAGPYPVGAIDVSKVHREKHSPIEATTTTGQCPNCCVVGPFFEECTTPTCHNVGGAWYGGEASKVKPLGIDLSTVQFPASKPAPIGVAARKPYPNAWTTGDLKSLKELWPTNSAATIGEALGRTAKAVALRANGMKLKKAQGQPVAVAAPAPAKTVTLPPALLHLTAKSVENEEIHPGLEAKFLKLVAKLGPMKLFKMDPHEAKQALQLLTNNLEKLILVPGAERLRVRLAGCYALPTQKMEGSQPRG